MRSADCLDTSSRASLTFFFSRTGRFNELYGGGPAQDRVRGQTIPAGQIKLDTLGEIAPFLEPAFSRSGLIRPSGPQRRRSRRRTGL